MGNILRYMVYGLFFLLFMFTVEQDDSLQSNTPLLSYPHCATSCYRRQQDPCEKTMNFLFTHRFADMPQTVLSFDNLSTSKFKCIVRILTAQGESQKRQQRTSRTIHPAAYPLHSDAVDYYIYALRRIVI